MYTQYLYKYQSTLCHSQVLQQAVSEHQPGAAGKENSQDLVILALLQLHLSHSYCYCNYEIVCILAVCCSYLSTVACKALNTAYRLLHMHLSELLFDLLLFLKFKEKKYSSLTREDFFSLIYVICIQ